MGIKKNKKDKSSKKKEETQATATPQTSKYLSVEELIAIDKKINAVISKFDYEKVQKAMTTLDWVWVNPCPEEGATVPTIERMKANSRYLLSRAATTPERVWSTGGFIAERYEDGELSLTFYVAQAYSHNE
jgi:hypothetical protein